MGMQQTPRRQKSPWARYAPFIAIVVVVAIVGVAIAAHGNSSKKQARRCSVTRAPPPAVSGTNGIPLFYNDAKAQGTAGDVAVAQL